MRAKSILRKLPWRILLPVIMLTATLALFYLDQIWLKGAGKWDDMPATSAWGMAALLNGPGFYVTLWLELPTVHILGESIHDLGRLFGVGVFWAWIGYLLERKLRGIRNSTIRNHWARVILYILGFAIACLLVMAGAQGLSHFDARYMHFLWQVLQSPTPRRRLLGRELFSIAALAWGIGYAAYFAIQLWHLLVRPYASANSARPT
jgi:hypothetical protein